MQEQEQNFSSEIADTRTDMIAEYAKTRTDLIVERAKTRTVLKAAIAKMRSDIIKWMFIFWIGQLGAMLGILFTFFK